MPHESRQRRFRLAAGAQVAAIEVAALSSQARIVAVTINGKRCRFEQHPLVPVITVSVDELEPGGALTVTLDMEGDAECPCKINLQPREADRWKQLLECRHALSESNAHWFFYELDLHTNRRFLPHAGLECAELAYRQWMLPELMGILTRRVNQRQEGRVDPLDSEHARHIAYVSALIRGIVDLHLGRDPATARAAFAAFGAGVLKQDCKPVDSYHACDVDGSGVLLFAELAFAALELSIDPDVWRNLLKTLVMMQELYLERLRPEDVVRTCVRNLPAPRRVLSAQEAGRLHLIYEKIPDSEDCLAAQAHKNLNRMQCFMLQIIQTRLLTDPFVER